MSQEFHKFWLKIMAIVVGGFAPVCILATMPATIAPMQISLDLLAWPPDGLPEFGRHSERFLSALMGGFLLGWAAMIWCLQAWVYDHAPEAVRRTVLIGALVWFVVDSAGSIASGTAINVVPNIAFLLIAVGPLWQPARPPQVA